MVKETISFIILCVLSLLFGVLIALLNGCAHRVEYYESGQVKLEEEGVLLSDGKSFSIISVN